MKGHHELGAVSLGIGLGVALEVVILLLVTLLTHVILNEKEAIKQLAEGEGEGENNASEWVRFTVRTLHMSCLQESGRLVASVSLSIDFVVLQVCVEVGRNFIVSYVLPFVALCITLVYAFKLRKNPDGLNEGKNYGMSE